MRREFQPYLSGLNTQSLKKIQICNVERVPQKFFCTYWELASYREDIS